MKILIVKKSQLTASMLCTFLVRQGHQVKVSDNYPKTHESKSEFKPEILIIEDSGEFEFSTRLDSIRHSFERHTYATILFTSKKTGPEILSLLHHGCHGLVHHDDDIEDLIECIKFIVNGYKYISPTIREHAVFTIAHADLTPTELEIARRILIGQSTKEIADSLCRSIETVQNHRSSIKSKLGIRGGKLAFYQTLLAVALGSQK